MNGEIRFTGKERAVLAPIGKPASPDPGCIMGKTLYSLISPGTELNAGFLQEHVKPATTGYASVFEVEEIGEGVDSAAIGDRFLCMHPHKSYQQVPVKEAIPVPAKLDPAEAAIARLLNIGMTTLMTTKARPGDNVLITGAGPIGFLSALLFARSGYEVMLCDPDEARLRKAQQAGIQRAVKEIPIQDSVWQGKVSLVLECSGHESAAIDSCHMLRKGGELVLAGVPWNRYTDRYAQELLSLVFHRYVTLRSGWEWELPIVSQDFMPHSVQENLRTGLRWLAEGLFDASPHIRKVSPMHAQEAYTELAGRQVEELFVLFDWTRMEGEHAE
ncbi:zinc-dependent alcohol dehydrogenase [Paenibacillus sp. MBLB4367]|uniref:zinc-dependent alcohol dehydrogenase n=1 Tax=Paenibacillus sp. MBLB4367 TaxID=3384767 RepID=UPI003908093F